MDMKYVEERGNYRMERISALKSKEDSKFEHGLSQSIESGMQLQGVRGTRQQRHRKKRLNVESLNSITTGLEPTQMNLEKCRSTAMRGKVLKSIHTESRLFTYTDSEDRCTWNFLLICHYFSTAIPWTDSPIEEKCTDELSGHIPEIKNENLEVSYGSFWSLGPPYFWEIRI